MSSSPDPKDSRVSQGIVAVPSTNQCTDTGFVIVLACITTLVHNLYYHIKLYSQSLKSLIPVSKSSKFFLVVRYCRSEVCMWYVHLP